MTRRMLINARVPEEVRIALIEGQTLENYQVEVAERGLTRGNIYRGIIAAIQPSLNAAFIDYGAERHGFLPIQDVVPAAYYGKPAKTHRPRIEDVLERGRPIVVQVTHEPEGTKGAALTTNLSLAGRYMVLTPFAENEGVSRKVSDEETRRELKEQVSQLERPAGSGIIIRTNALGQNKVALNRDLNALLRLWKRIATEARQGKSKRLLYSDQDLILRAMRDHLDNSVQEVLVDTDEAYEKVREYMRAFMPRSRTRLVRYTDRAPLFARYGIDPQIESIYERRVELSSGGSIVIDQTEALVAIDVNSGRSVRAASQEETALGTNLEAAQEVARQLRLRDIGGLIVVDFIDMESRRNQRNLEKAVREAMKTDRARFNVGRVSPNGLLEINRQRIQQALLTRTYRPCPTCSGIGRIASAELVGLRMLRRIEHRATDGFKGTVRIELHPELADGIQNGRRREIHELEQEFDLTIEVIASPRLHRAQENVEWIASSAPPAKSPATVGRQQPKPATIQDSAPGERRRSGGRSRRPAKKRAATKPASNGAASNDVAKREPTRQESSETPPGGKPKEGGGRGRPRRSRRRRSRSSNRKSTPAAD